MDENTNLFQVTKTQLIAEITKVCLTCIHSLKHQSECIRYCKTYESIECKHRNSYRTWRIC